MYFCLIVDEESDLLLFRANFSELLLLIVTYARSHVTLTPIILFVCVVPGVWSQQLGICVLPEVKLPQRITQMFHNFHLPVIDRIEPLLQYCSCCCKTMMNSISNRVHHAINKLDKTARLNTRCLL